MAAWGGWTLALLLGAVTDEDRPRILFLAQSAGYQHSVVTRTGDALSHAERTFRDIAPGWQIDCTQDCTVLTAENLANYDAVVFFTTGELPVPDRDPFIAWVQAGGAFVGIHCATDTWYEFSPYMEMIGATFDGHPWHTNVGIRVEDAAHPAMEHLGEGFEITDEIYQFRGHSRDRTHVLMSLDTTSVRNPERERDYPLAWCRGFGEGRVFYTALGHREEVWNDPRFQAHLLGGIRWAMRDESAGCERILYDSAHIDGWRQAGPGGFTITEDGVAIPHGGMGLWYHEQPFRDFILRLEFQQERIDCNSGVFVRFPDPGDDPWVAVNQGYEVQIAGDTPADNTTGAIYSFQAATEIPIRPAGEWNEYEIACIGHRYTVRLNGIVINVFTGDRSVEGRIGVQNHDDGSVVRYRNIRVVELGGAR